MNLPVEMEGAAIILLGSFNPAIFQTSWFLHQGLISASDAADAVPELTTPKLSVMTMAGMRLIVEPERFQAEITGLDSLAPVRDLILGTFRILEHTPARVLGINHHAHYRMTSEEQWHKVGHKLAPKEVWQGLVESPGTRAVHILGKRTSSAAKYLLVQVEPSQKVTNGVYVGTVEQYESTSLSQLLEWLASQWEDSQRFARNLGPMLIERCLTNAAK